MNSNSNVSGKEELQSRMAMLKPPPEKPTSASIKKQRCIAGVWFCTVLVSSSPVKNVRITLCTFRAATTSPDARRTEFVSKHLQLRPLRKSPRKKVQIGRERPHFFAAKPPKSSAGRSRPHKHFASMRFARVTALTREFVRHDV